MVVTGVLVAVAVVLAGAAVAVGVRGGGAAVARALGAAAGCVALAALVFGLALSDETLDATDGPVLGWMVEHRTPARTTAAEVVSLLGGTVGTGALAVVAALVLALRGRRVRALVWVLAVVVGSLTIRGLKVSVERPRPPVGTRLAVETTTSLPSGHSLMAALGVGLTVLAALTLLGPAGTRRGGRAVLRPVVVLAGLVVVAVIGASRAYLGVHWTTDVLAGWLLGAALAALAVAVATVLEQRSSRSIPQRE